MTERYQSNSTENGSQWQSLTEMPDFAAHEEIQYQQQNQAEHSEIVTEDASPDGLAREIGSVVERALGERTRQDDLVDDEGDLYKTQVIESDILDDDWAPEFDRSYRRELSTQERYDQCQKDIERIDDHLQQTPERQTRYLEMLDTIVGSMKGDIRRFRATAAASNVAPETIPGYGDLYRLTCERRREYQMLQNPQEQRATLVRNRKMLGRELAKSDPHYHDAIEGMDPEIVDQNIDAILESTPPRDFNKLAKLMNRKDKWLVFREQVQDVLVRALGIEDININVEMFDGGPNGVKGDCTPIDDGYLVRLNTAVIGQDAWAYAKILAHEFYHVMQNQVSKAGGTEMAELYDFNMQHYGRPNEVGYKAYKSQLKEAEAFRFMDRFLDEIRKGDVRNRQTLVGRIKHWWEERDTEKMPENAVIGSVSGETPSTEEEVLLGTDEDKTELSQK